MSSLTSEILNLGDHPLDLVQVADETQSQHAEGAGLGNRGHHLRIVQLTDGPLNDGVLAAQNIQELRHRNNLPRESMLTGASPAAPVVSIDAYVAS